MEKNRDSLDRTLRSIRESDWGEEPAVFFQPPDWPPGKTSASRNYRRILDAALADGCDFAVILEDDVRVNRHLRYNLTHTPLVVRDQCDYFSLFMPDLIMTPWERAEPHLGYRLSKPLYRGPNTGWEKFRLWGSQAYVLSRRYLAHAVQVWDALDEGQDARVIHICERHRLPMWYSDPCLVQHDPTQTAFGTPLAYAGDYDPDFKLGPAGGFEPPDAVPGWLTLPEAKLLWEQAAGKHVLEIGTCCGKATVCLAQQAASVVSVDLWDQPEAAEWVRRYGRADRVEFRRGAAADVCPGLGRTFDLALVDGLHDADSVARDIAAVLPRLAPGGRIAFHDYPDPGWPAVRRTVDDHAKRLGWRRVAQADFLGVFAT